MSHSQFHSTNLFILRHAWLNLWDKHMTTGRINQVTIVRTAALKHQRSRFFPDWKKGVFTQRPLRHSEKGRDTIYKRRKTAYAYSKCHLWCVQQTVRRRTRHIDHLFHTTNLTSSRYRCHHFINFPSHNKSKQNGQESPLQPSRFSMSDFGANSFTRFNPYRLPHSASWLQVFVANDTHRESLHIHHPIPPTKAKPLRVEFFKSSFNVFTDFAQVETQRTSRVIALKPHVAKFVFVFQRNPNVLAVSAHAFSALPKQHSIQFSSWDLDLKSFPFLAFPISQIDFPCRLTTFCSYLAMINW